MAHRLAVILVAIGLAVTSRPRAAEACTPPWEGVTDRQVLPEDGADGVPRNARVLVWYDSHGADPGIAVIVRPAGGEPIAAAISMPLTLGFAKLITPDQPLEAATTYEVLDTLALPCETQSTSECLGDPAVIATFTTGAGMDTSPPSLAGVTVESGFWCVPESCPDAEIEMIDRISVADHTDDHPDAWIRYEYLALDGQVLAGPTHWLYTGRGCGGGPGDVPLWYYLSLPPEVQLRAVDLAGNRETTAHAITGGSCDLVGDGCDPDAGVGDGGVDGGDETGGGDGGGCGGCTTGRPLDLGAVLLLALTFLPRSSSRRPRKIRSP